MKDYDKTLVVGDVHCAPGQNLRRADWLGKYIADTKPARLIYIGDFATIDSLSAWDRDKRKKMENRRYAKDMDSCNEFLDRVAMYAGKAMPGDRRYLMGNHEYREDRYIEYHPELEGYVDINRQCGLESERGFAITPYKEYTKHKGIGFTHVPIQESGAPVSGKYATDRALQVCDQSVIFGHTHKLNYVAVHPHGRKHLKEALNVGCYFEHVDEYALGSVTSYWRGLVMLDHYKYGRFSYQTIPMGKLRREYGTK